MTDLFVSYTTLFKKIKNKSYTYFVVILIEPQLEG